jgi:uncharacterized protein involved in exopolysaccharide biosynthesis
MKEILPSPPRRIIFIEQDDVVNNGGRLEPAGDAPSLRDYWQVVRKHRWKVLACLAFAVIMSGVAVFITTPTYIARATLMIERKGPQVVKIKQVSEEADAADETGFYESQYQVLKSRSLAAAVIKAQKLDKDPAFISQSAETFSLGQLLSIPFDWLVNLIPQAAPMSTSASAPPSNGGIDSGKISAYTRMVSIDPVKRSRIVTVGISSPNAELAARIANAHVDGYIQQGFKLKSQVNEEA